jgi:transposase
LETSRAISAAELERMMKLQDVILKAMAKKITWLEAAEIIGVCDRTMRRMRERYQEFGYDGLFDQRRRKRTTLRVPMATAERVLTLYQETYFDLSVRHFHEKLREEHAIELSYIWVKQALQVPAWWRGARSVARIAGGVPGGLCLGCCCILTAANTAGFPMTVTTICW